MTLIAAYSFDSGAVIDDSGGGRNGTLVNSPTFPTGHTNLGLQCASASSQYVTVADDPIWNLGSAWTIMCWAKPTTLVATEWVCKQNQWWFGMTSGGQFTFGFYYSVGGNTAGIGSVTTASTGTWYHLANRYDGTNYQLVINGTQDSTLNDGGSASGKVMVDAATPVRMGSWDGASEFMNGIIDDVKIFNTYMNDAAVTTEMNIPVTGVIPFFDINPTSHPHRTFGPF